MALNKTKTMTVNGNTITGAYWKIINVTVNKQTMVATWAIALFANQTYADTVGATPCGPTYYFKASVTKTQIADDMIALGYATIMSQISGPAPTRQQAVGLNGSNPNAWTDLSGATNC